MREDPNVTITDLDPKKEVKPIQVDPPTPIPVSAEDDDMASALAVYGFGPGATPKPAETPAEKPPETPVKEPGPTTPTPTTPETPPTPPEGTPAPAGVPPETPAQPPEAKPEGRKRKTHAESMTEAAESMSAAAQRLMEASKPAPAPVAPPVVVDPSEELTDAALAFLAERHPSYRGRNLKKEIEAWEKEADKYESEWLRKNPDAEFDPDARDHDGWNDKHPEPVSEAALESAKLAVMQHREHQQEISNIRQEQTWLQVQQVVAAESAAVPNDILKALGAKSWEGFGEKEPEMSLVALGGITGDDPGIVAETVRLTQAANYGRFYGLHPSRDATHAKLLPLVREWEAGLSPEDRASQEGRTFIEYEKSHSIPPTERANYWTVLDFPQAVRSTLVERAKQQIETRADALKKRLNRTGAAVPAANTAPSTPPPAAAAAAAAAAAPPSAPAVGDKPPEGGTGTVRTPGALDNSTPKNLDRDYFFGARS